MLTIRDILQPENVSYTDNVWTWAVAHMLHKGEDWQITTITDTAPIEIVFLSKGEPLMDYLISGNTTQNGTPTPESPVDVVGCGMKTGNLFDYRTMAGTIKGYYLDSSGNLVQGELAAITDYIPCSGGKFSLAKIGGVAASICLYDENKQFLYGKAYNTPSGLDKRTIIVDTSFNASFIRFTYFYTSVPIDDISAIMLNSGTKALPYEPYGYKLPISSGGENMFDATIEQGSISTSGNIPANNRVRTKEYINVESNYITLSWDSSQNTEAYIFMYDENGDYVSDTGWRASPTTYQLSSTIKKIRIIWRYNSQADISPSAITNIMLNTGSIPLPYEPYNRITTPIYLGQVETTRRVKKLVLTGDETFTINASGDNTYFAHNLIKPAIRTQAEICTHLTYATIGASNTDVGFSIIASGAELRIRIPNTATTSLADFKAWLAAQYAAGTPVTIWYVLATPETGIVNEPLNKIGDYADTVSMAQAGVTIPTVAGANALTVDTTVQPSEVSITGNIKEVN